MAKPGKNRVSLDARRGGHYDAGAEYARNTIGKKLAEGRRRRGLSQGEFASLLGDFGIRIGLRGYAKWETGETVPNAYQLLAIYHALQPPEGESWLSGGEAPLNEEGLRKLGEYREDLLASGRYKPAARVEDNAVEYREALVSRLRPSAGPGNFLDEENFEKRLFPADSIPAGELVGYTAHKADSLLAHSADVEAAFKQIFGILSPKVIFLNVIFPKKPPLFKLLFELLFEL